MFSYCKNFISLHLKDLKLNKNEEDLVSDRFAAIRLVYVC